MAQSSQTIQQTVINPSLLQKRKVDTFKIANAYIEESQGQKFLWFQDQKYTIIKTIQKGGLKNVYDLTKYSQFNSKIECPELISKMNKNMPNDQNTNNNLSLNESNESESQTTSSSNNPSKDEIIHQTINNNIEMEEEENKNEIVQISHNYDEKPKLILDLDETLAQSQILDEKCYQTELKNLINIHTRKGKSWQNIDQIKEKIEKNLFQIKFQGKENNIMFALISFRPNLKQYLKQLSEYYEIFIYSHGIEQYVKAALELINKDEILINPFNVFSNTTGSQFKHDVRKNLNNLQTFPKPIYFKDFLIVDDIFEVWDREYSNNIIVCQKYSPFESQMQKFHHFIFGKSDQEDLLKITTNYTDQYSQQLLFCQIDMTRDYAFKCLVDQLLKVGKIFNSNRSIDLAKLYWNQFGESKFQGRKVFISKEFTNSTFNANLCEVSAGLVKKMGGQLILNSQEASLIISLGKNYTSNCIDLDNSDYEINNKEHLNFTELVKIYFEDYQTCE